MFGSDLAEVSFEFRECLFDRVQDRRVWRQIEKPAAVFTQGLCRLFAPVRRQIVEDVV